MDGIALPLPTDETLLDLIRRGLKTLASVLTNAGRDIVTNRIMGAGTEPKYIGWGTTAGTAGIGDTTLFGEKAADLTATSGTRPAGTSSRTGTGNDTYQVTGTLTMTAAGPISVTNAGLFDSATLTAGAGGNLYVKGDFTPIPLSLNDSIAFTFKHQLT